MNELSYDVKKKGKEVATKRTAKKKTAVAA